MRRSKYLVAALAAGALLAAVGFLVWVYYTTMAELDRRSLSGTGSDTTDPWFESDPVDPADLHGTWTSRAEAGDNRRELVLDFRPDGKLVWTTRVTVGERPIVKMIERHDYQFERGRFLLTTLTEVSVIKLGPRLVGIYIDVTLGAAITVPAGGNITNTKLLLLPAAWWPSAGLGHELALSSGSGGPIAGYTVSPVDGSVKVVATSDAATLSIGTGLNTSGQYVVDPT